MHEQPTIRTPTISLILVMAVSVAVSGCAITGHEIVENRVVVPAGAVAKVRAVCPSGKKVLGGGFDMEIPQDLRVYASGSGRQPGEYCQLWLAGDGTK